jgi:hypothetical protein
VKYRHGWIGLVLSLVLWLPASSQAQTATPASRLAWDQVAPSLAEASSYLYEATYDGGALVVLSGVTCTGAASPFVCSAGFPATFPSGAHMVQVRTVDIEGTTRLESPLSAVFNFMFLGLPSAPTNLRITG